MSGASSVREHCRRVLAIFPCIYRPAPSPPQSLLPPSSTHPRPDQEVTPVRHPHLPANLLVDREGVPATRAKSFTPRRSKTSVRFSLPSPKQRGHSMVSVGIDNWVVMRSSRRFSIHA